MTLGSSDPLRIWDVSVQFGGLQALGGVSLTVRDGGIVGLIGPNGAGKTTLFDCVTGMTRTSRGRIELFGRDAQGLAVHERAQLGVARTFQKLELFGSLSVLENLVVAYEAHARRGGLVSDMFALPASVETRADALERGKEVLGELGLARYADARAGEVPGGIARLVELARAVCTDPKFLLLDEPSSGLRAKESGQVAEYLRACRDRGMSILVVEHDMRFVLGLCDHVYVLDFGRVIGEGTPDAIRRDPAVQAAYLGQEVG